ncbi:capsid protein [Pacific flying fox faeces associated gemycircularvirus-1]|uniref:Capsid protein n=2 Tax=pteropus associated gemygorvirus 1 TaxID=1985427 RepID=A0A140CTK5_9VIRU|nr:capsid protein [Pacific flying fox faeces associated gemycircularvirus-1]AMH87659.1 capsid protein [Pacific flying fox faeces associated gemycircularvirus-1]AMH87662.1 capsid protein [Pacific flying fox faeces associated gemycircularvirus-1]
MPRRYSRRRRFSRARRRTVRFSSASTSRIRRTRRTPRRRLSRRRILNIASIKKHDNMMPYVRTPEGPANAGPITTGTGFTSLFMPSARVLAQSSEGEASRERQQIYAVGYKETCQVDILGGGVWKWRRVVFTYKGDWLYSGDVTWTEPWYDKSTDPAATDMTRLIAQPTTDQLTRIKAILWDGGEGVDWQSEFTAKVDTQRVTPLYDRTITFNPRNESGYSRTFKIWHPIRKNIMYQDDEDGISRSSGFYTSTDGKPGVGDVYVYDIAYLVVPATTGNAAMTFNPEGTFYWHER